MQWASKQSGFTIVELLIVVVVIAILAAITVVSYAGITNQANDASMKTRAEQVEKKIRTNQVQRGEQYVSFRSNMYAPEQLPSSRLMVLDGNDLTSFGDVTCVEWYVTDANDANSGQDPGCFPSYVINQVPQFNKKKLYLSVHHDTTAPGGESTYISYSYWNNSKGYWVIKEVSKSPGSAEVVATDNNACTPVHNPANGPAHGGTLPIYNAQCRYTGP